MHGVQQIQVVPQGGGWHLVGLDWAVTILTPILILVLSGCAYQPSGALSPSAPGFWLGLWHGFIAPISLVGSFFADHRIYAFPNAGVLYDLGFLLGLSAWGGGGAYSARS